MRLDVNDGPPRSVKIQRELEELIDEIRSLVDGRHLVGAWLLVVLGYTVATGDGASSSTSTAWLEGVTLVDVARAIAIALAGGIVLAANIAMHELCHWVAFRRVGISAEWSISWLSVGGYSVYPFPAGGVCEARSVPEYARMSWSEGAFVALAPLAWAAAVLAGVGAYHVFVDAIASLWWIVAGVVLLAGPSPPDWGSIVETPRERWEFLVGLEDRLEKHAAAEGLER